MNKKLYRIMSVVMALVLTVGGYFEVQASSAGAPQMSANSYYVSTAGSDSNSGTLTSPFSTISKGMSVAQAGNVVYVRAGTYSAFSVAKSGLTVAGYNGERPLVSGGSGIRCYNKSDITIKGFEVIGVSGNYIGGITLDGCTNVVVDGNKVHDNTSVSVSGIVVLGSNNKILNNEVYNNNFSGIRVYGTSQNNEIGFNKVYNHTLSAGNSDGIDLYNSAVTQTNIHDNTVFGNSDDGIDTWDSPGNVVKNNVAYGNGGTGDGNGFKMGGSTTGGNNIVVGNISYSNKTCGFTSNGNGDYFEANTSYNNGTSGFSDLMRTSGNTQTSSLINNVAYNNPGGNFKLNSTYTTVFLGNSEVPPSSSTTVPTSTSVVAPTTTPTSKPTTMPTIMPTITNTMVVAPSFTPTLMPTVVSTSTLAPTATLPAATPVPATPTVVEIATLPTVAVTPSPTVQASPIPVDPTLTLAPPTVPPSSEVIYDDRDGAFVYSSGWETVSKRQAYNGSYRVTSRKDSNVTFSFTGQSFSVLYKGGSDFRNMDVYVDNTLVGTIDERTDGSSYQQRWDYAGLLIPGSHTLKLVFVSSRRQNGSVDAVIVR